jgi:hypothetical protein
MAFSTQGPRGNRRVTVEFDRWGGSFAVKPPEGSQCTLWHMSSAEPISASAPRPLRSPLTLRNFRLLWIGETVSVFGDQFYLIALPWLALQLTGSGLALGSVLMTAGIPRAALMMAGGAATDRFSSRSVMLVSNIMRCGIVTLLTVLVYTHRVHLWHRNNGTPTLSATSHAFG